MSDALDDYIQLEMDYKAKCAECDQLREGLEAQGRQWDADKEGVNTGWHTFLCAGDQRKYHHWSCLESCQLARAALGYEEVAK